MAQQGTYQWHGTKQWLGALQWHGALQQHGALQWHNSNEMIYTKTKVKVNKEVEGYK